jgi:hypothetical protein
VKEYTGFREVDAPADAAKKANPQSAFQFVDLCGNVWLADIQFLGGARETGMPGDAFKNSQGTDRQ